MCRPGSPTCVLFGSLWTSKGIKEDKRKESVKKMFGCSSYNGKGTAAMKENCRIVSDFVYGCTGISHDVQL